MKRSIAFEDESLMPAILGDYDSVLRRVESSYECDIRVRGNEMTVSGEETVVARILELFRQLEELAASGRHLDEDTVARVMDMAGVSAAAVLNDVIISYRGKAISPKTPNQKAFVDAIRRDTVVFAIGPAGTGKTYLAMAMAIAAYKRHEVNRIILTRPAVEAGEKLGFLPGDIAEKVNPYLRPLYDAIYDMMEPEKVQGLIESGIIEIAPLAFMRGRTLNDSYIILDEAQNTSPAQMKMFLTRLGFGSKAVITGDITQIDLPSGEHSGLLVVRQILEGIADVAFIEFKAVDVVRHKLVQRIVDAYRRYEGEKNE